LEKHQKLHPDSESFQNDSNSLSNSFEKNPSDEGENHKKNIGYKDEDTDFSQRGVSRVDDSSFS
jgi:hypothetical protein